MQLYVEKVFIAQKTSEDRGGQVKKREKGAELLVGSRERNLGGGRGGRSEEKTNGLEFTRWRRHIARQGNNCATEEEVRNDT